MTAQPTRSTFLFLWSASLVAGTAGQRLPAAPLRNHPAISYERASVSDAVSQLNTRLRAGVRPASCSDLSGSKRITRP